MVINKSYKIATIGSHSALQILKGAQQEGFKTVCICIKGREKPYQQFKVADKIISIKNFDQFDDTWEFGVFKIQVSIDIKPGSFPNCINLGSNGTVPVAIISTETFDATTVDPLTVTLASAPVKLKGKGTPMASFQDVNGDSLLDLVVHVSTEALQVTNTDTEAVVEGKTYGGGPIRGTDTIRVVP